MNIETFDRLLQSYGTSESHWPAEMRDAARQLLADDDQARALVERYAPLDAALDKYAVNPNMARIRAALVAQVGRKNIIDRITDWLLPQSGNLHAFWRPALAAALPLILGIILGSTLSFGSTSNTTDTWNNEMSLVALSSTNTESLP